MKAFTKLFRFCALSLAIFSLTGCGFYRKPNLINQYENIKVNFEKVDFNECNKTYISNHYSYRTDVKRFEDGGQIYSVLFIYKNDEIIYEEVNVDTITVMDALEKDDKIYFIQSKSSDEITYSIRCLFPDKKIKTLYTTLNSIYAFKFFDNKILFFETKNKNDYSYILKTLSYNGDIISEFNVNFGYHYPLDIIETNDGYLLHGTYYDDESFNTSFFKITNNGEIVDTIHTYKNIDIVNYDYLNDKLSFFGYIYRPQLNEFEIVKYINDKLVILNKVSFPDDYFYSLDGCFKHKENYYFPVAVYLKNSSMSPFRRLVTLVYDPVDNKTSTIFINKPFTDQYIYNNSTYYIGSYSSNDDLSKDGIFYKIVLN